MLTALIVEDDIDEGERYRQALSGIEGLYIAEAKNGKDALELVQRQIVDLFLLDIQMPEIDGLDLARRIRELPGHRISPILFLTGYSKNPLEVFRELHCYDYLMKPITMDVLTRKVTELIESMEIERQKIHTVQQLISLETENGMVFCPVDQIRFAEMVKGQCHICTERGVLPLWGISLTGLIEEVGQDFFVQCHKSFAVNVRYITEIMAVDYRKWEIFLKGCKQIVEMSRRYKPHVDEAIQCQLHRIQHNEVND